MFEGFEGLSWFCQKFHDCLKGCRGFQGFQGFQGTMVRVRGEQRWCCRVLSGWWSCYALSAVYSNTDAISDGRVMNGTQSAEARDWKPMTVGDPGWGPSETLSDLCVLTHHKDGGFKVLGSSPGTQSTECRFRRGGRPTARVVAAHSHRCTATS